MTQREDKEENEKKNAHGREMAYKEKLNQNALKHSITVKKRCLQKNRQNNHTEPARRQERQ